MGGPQIKLWQSRIVRSIARELYETDDDYRNILKEENREIVSKEEKFLGNNNRILIPYLIWDRGSNLIGSTSDDMNEIKIMKGQPFRIQGNQVIAVVLVL